MEASIAARRGAQKRRFCDQDRALYGMLLPELQVWGKMPRPQVRSFPQPKTRNVGSEANGCGGLWEMPPCEMRQGSLCCRCRMSG